jgi:AcrR family transcriptional regulator
MPPVSEARSTRDLLVDVAGDLLDEGGPENVTLREVGRRAGVSHNAPYKHFPDKRALLAAVAARELDATAQTLLAAPGLDAAVHAYVDRSMALPHRFDLVNSRWDVENPVLRAAAERAGQALTSVVATGVEQGQLPAAPVGELADLLRAAVHGLVTLEFAGHLGKASNAGVHTLVDRLLEQFRR